MRPLPILASALGFLLGPGTAHAQTEGIQREVEVRLWIQRLLAKAQAATGAPPLVSGLTLIALAVALLVACLWLWMARRGRENNVPR
jgi:hypothetical protein